MVPAAMVASGADNILGGFSTIVDAIYSSSAFMSFTGAAGYDVSSEGLPEMKNLPWGARILGQTPWTISLSSPRTLASEPACAMCQVHYNR